MIKRSLLLFALLLVLPCALCAQVLFPAGNTTTPPTLFPIDPAQRGGDLINVFQRLQGAPYSDKTTYEIALTTMVNGVSSFIPFVNKIIAPSTKSANASYNTLLIIWYRLQPGGDNSLNKYQVLPVEQITQMIYSQQTIASSTIQNIVFSQGMAPYYTVNPVQRAADIQSAVYTLNYLRPYNNNQTGPNVSLTTTLRGTYNGQLLQNGVIPFVREIQTYGSMMTVTYQLSQSNNVAQYIVVSAEEVISINYLKN